ncbi:MAG: flagellar motor protein MotB [Gammaproteobacteria bacterium]
MRGHFHTELLEDLHDDSAPADRWILSYADFITLLFAFFVVMYSISSVNDGKFRVLSASLLAVFQDPQVSAALAERRIARGEEAVVPLPAALDGELDAGNWVSDPLALRADDLATVIEALVAARAAAEVTVRESADWTEIELPATLTFEPDGRLAEDAAGLVDVLAELARAVDVPVRIEGFTDNVPSGGDGQPSHWERSAAQAAAVAARLVAAGVDARRVSATGFGAQFPVASNASASGRAQNRRVVIAIARHEAVPAAAASLAARTEREEIAPRTLQRVTELPAPEVITL